METNDKASAFAVWEREQQAHRDAAALRQEMLRETGGRYQFRRDGEATWLPLSPDFESASAEVSLMASLGIHGQLRSPFGDITSHRTGEVTEPASQSRASASQLEPSATEEAARAIRAAFGI